jgi:choline dehydrogenase-like flavoprotein
VLRAFLDQFPNPDNRVSLAPDTDRYGDRKARISWNFTDADRRTVREFFSRLKHELGLCRVGQVEIDPTLLDGDWPLVGIHSHLMGTTRMGDSAKTSVVDRNCRVFACNNLYIAGPSTFPTSGYANPFLTIAALSLRLADHLKQSIEKR